MLYNIGGTASATVLISAGEMKGKWATGVEVSKGLRGDDEDFEVVTDRNLVSADALLTKSVHTGRLLDLMQARQI